MDAKQEAGEVARARLAFVSAGQRPLSAPRRAHNAAQEVVELTEPEPPPRQRRRWWDQLPSALGLNLRHVIVIAVLLLVAGVLAALALMRSSATAVPLNTVTAAPVSSSPSPAASPATIRVHVAGAVASPGVVQLPDGAIVQDAIEAAGGLTGEADPDLLNLAAPLVDGAQVIIGTQDEPHGEIIGAPAPSGDTGGLVNLNRASAAELEELPGIGPVSAQAIIAWREDNGGFKSVSQLQEVSGIGPKTFAKLEPLVTV